MLVSANFPQGLVELLQEVSDKVDALSPVDTSDQLTALSTQQTALAQNLTDGFSALDTRLDATDLAIEILDTKTDALTVLVEALDTGGGTGGGGSTIPTNAVTHDGEPVTHNGDFVIHTL
jgi:hypothetical protein